MKTNTSFMIMYSCQLGYRKLLRDLGRVSSSGFSESEHELILPILVRGEPLSQFLDSDLGILADLLNLPSN